MNRLPRKGAGSVQNEPAPHGPNNAKASADAMTTANKPSLSVGWRLAVLVWVCAFFGLFLYELAGLLLKITGKSV